MKANVLIKIFVVIIVLVSCKSVKMSNLQIPKNPNKNLLPALEPKVNVASLEDAYSLGTSALQGGGGVNYALSVEPVEGLSLFSGGQSLDVVRIKDKRVRETMVLFGREVQRNLTNPFGKRKGIIELTITNSNIRITKWGWYFPSLLSFTLLNVFGMPMCYFRTELELSVAIKDKQGNLISSYTGVGKSEVPVAYYYGYYCSDNLRIGRANVTSSHGASRKTNIDAVKMAMQQIKNKINKDYSNIITKLGG